MDKKLNKTVKIGIVRIIGRIECIPSKMSNHFGKASSWQAWLSHLVNWIHRKESLLTASTHTELLSVKHECHKRIMVLRVNFSRDIRSRQLKLHSFFCFFLTVASSKAKSFAVLYTLLIWNSGLHNVFYVFVSPLGGEKRLFTRRRVAF